MKTTLIVLILVVGSLSVFSQSYDRSGLIPALAPFYHGVASGDPLADRVIIWTRATPDSTVATGDSIEIVWRMCSDTGMTNVINSGTGYAKELTDWTFKKDVTGLASDECYFYDFLALGKYSIRGRTFTAPTGDVDSLRFGVVSCSNYEHGYFNSYARLLQRNDFSAILHLGDYIYEYEQGGYSASILGRDQEPANEIISLTDYRVRHSHYKLDDDLRLLHQQYPFITVWDDHESANDSYLDGAENHSPGSEGLWSDRKAYSKQAYHEYMPIRTAVGSDKIYRTINYGDLVNLYMCDTRLEGRTEQGAGSNDASRSLLGATQHAWFMNEMETSTSQWNVMGQQVMMAPLELFGSPLDEDQWDGYDFDRNEIYNFVLDSNIQNFVVLTGDIHTSWANDLPGSGYDASTGTGSVGVEFVVTSVTSPGFPISVPSSTLQLENDHMKYIDLTEHGYLILDINKQRTQADWYYVDEIINPSTNEYYADGYYVNDGERHLNQASGLSTSGSNYGKTYAPPMPMSAPTGVSEFVPDIEIFGAYPNPFQNEFTVQYYLFTQTPLKISVYNSLGQKVFDDEVEQAHKGLNYMNLDVEGMSKGTYQIVLSTKRQVLSKTIIKSN